MLPGEEQRERVHKNKAILEAERQAKDAIANSKMENTQLEQQKDRIRTEAQQAEQRKEEAESKLVTLESYLKALHITKEDLVVPSLNTNPLVIEALKSIQAELDKPIPSFGGQKEWRDERKKAVKMILTDMQTALFNAKEAQKQDILKLGQSLYKKAMKDVQAIIEQNRQLQKANEQLTDENKRLKKIISTMDETAVNNLRKQKDAEIERLQKEYERANTHAVLSDNLASKEHQRAENAENQVQDMLAIPEIKELWDTIQQNKTAFWQQIDKWIDEAVAAIKNFAKDYEHNDFMPKQGNAVAMGIIAEAFKNNLDATNDEQRMAATHQLLGKVSWTGTTGYMSEFATTRTKQLCEEMNVTKEMMKDLLLMAGGRVSISAGGGGSDNELTTWDGRKKRKGWGIS